jgi:hypothetical protein
MCQQGCVGVKRCCAACRHVIDGRANKLYCSDKCRWRAAQQAHRSDDRSQRDLSSVSSPHARGQGPFYAETSFELTDGTRTTRFVVLYKRSDDPVVCIERYMTASLPGWRRKTVTETAS